MKLRKRFAAMGAAMVMAVSMMSFGVSANWSETKTHYIFDFSASYSNKTSYREAKTTTTNKYNRYTLLGSRASYRDSTGKDVSTVYTTQAKSHGGTHSVTNQGSPSSSLKSSYHYSEIYNSASTMSGVADSDYAWHLFTYTG